MGILDKLLGRGKKETPQTTERLAKGLEVQTDEQQAASRSKMEAEMEGNRASRDAARKE